MLSTLACPIIWVIVCPSAVAAPPTFSVPSAPGATKVASPVATRVSNTATQDVDSYRTRPDESWAYATACYDHHHIQQVRLGKHIMLVEQGQPCKSHSTY